jgi:hypothetical protein
MIIMKRNLQGGNILAGVILIISVLIGGLSVADFNRKSDLLKEQDALVKVQSEVISSQSDALVLGAFRPSNYVGKLLTRLTEGGAESTFNTTPGLAKDGSTLTTAKLGDFIVLTINPGAANEEKISASAISVSGTTATWTIINRGLSYTENAAVTANKKQHAIGETVIISNDDHYLVAQFPAKDQAETITGSWSFPAPTIDANAATKEYVDDLSFGGIPQASATAGGFSELATGLEAASSTPSGGNAVLVLPASIATSTYNSATAALKVVVTGNTGKIDSNFLASGIVSTSTTANFATSSINIGSFPAYQIGKQRQVITSVGTSTFTVPTGIDKLIVEVQGGGGSGAGELSSSGNNAAGGGGGGYSQEIVDVTGTTSIQVFVGSGGEWSTFGTNGSYLYATPGTAASSKVEGVGGNGVGGDINIGGSDGMEGGNGSSPANGGSSHLGGGGAGTILNDTSGSSGKNYGGGGGGAGGSTSPSGGGGSGAQGIVIITW